MNTEAIVNKIEHYTGLYTGFADSRDTTDRDNAEFLRLASIVLREVRLELIEEFEATLRSEDYVVTPVADVIAKFRQLCGDYLNTGRRLDDAGEAMADFRVRYREYLKSKMATAPDGKAKAKPPKVEWAAIPDGPAPVPPANADPDFVDLLADQLQDVLEPKDVHNKK